MRMGWECVNTERSVKKHSSCCKRCEIRATKRERELPLPFSLRHLLAKGRSVERFEELKGT
jgi:hypothetical protein